MVPEPSAISDAVMDDGVPITLRRHGNPSGPRLVLSHGTGLAIDAYYPFWSLLTDRFDLVVYDLRSHGENPVGPLRTFNMPRLVSDNVSVIDHIDARFGSKPTVGVYHSLSTAVALLQQRSRRTFAALMLFDPPICPPGGRPEDLVPAGQLWAQIARGRQRNFESPEDYARKLKAADSFRALPLETLELLARATLRQNPEGGYSLRCPPEHEAQIVEYYFGWAMQLPDFLRNPAIPVKAYGADPTLPYAYMPGRDLDTLVALDYDFLPDATHALPLEEPEKCASEVIDFLEEHSLA